MIKKVNESDFSDMLTFFKNNFGAVFKDEYINWRKNWRIKVYNKLYKQLDN